MLREGAGGALSMAQGLANTADGTMRFSETKSSNHLLTLFLQSCGETLGAV
tara:strand:- start:354 stop:506 length:153 start_codon:yes stop_codon:yes gene_type:complete